MYSEPHQKTMLLANAKLAFCEAVRLISSTHPIQFSLLASGIITEQVNNAKSRTASLSKFAAASWLLRHARIIALMPTVDVLRRDTLLDHDERAAGAIVLII